MNNSQKVQGGSIILTALAMVAIIAIVGYFLADLFVNGQKRTIAEEVILEADSLSTDLIETTKFMLLYEPILFLDKPLDHSGQRAQQWKKLMAMGWGTVSSETLDMARACGGYDGKGKQIGEYRIADSRVFCPAYLRSPLFNNNMFEQMVLEPLVAKGIAKRPPDGRAGIYDIEMVFYDRDQGIDSLTPKGRGFYDLNIDQKILQSNQKLQRATVNIRILTSSAGFQGVGSERMVEITSLVELKDMSIPYRARSQQEFLIHPSTPKDFSLFIMYPQRADGTRTNSFRESVLLPAGSEIQGRVFFNGNLDVPLADLPTFHEVVIISGDFVPALTPSAKSQLRSKFKKGIISRYSAARFIHTGNCSTDNPEAVFTNSSQLPCLNESGKTYGMNDYLEKFSKLCLQQDMIYQDGVYQPRLGFTGSGPADSCKGSGLLSGAYSTLEVLGSYAMIASPIGALKINPSVKNIYGTVFGGFISAQAPITIKSFAHLTWEEVQGKPGIGGNQATFEALNASFQGAYEGITTILVNLPIVYSGDSQ